MEESFESILMAGGKLNTLGRAGEVLQEVLADRARLDELFGCISDEDAWVRMRAIDTFEKVAREHPTWVELYLDRLLGEIATIDQPSIRWHLAEIWGEVALTTIQRTQAIGLMKQWLATTSVDWIVAANCMKTLTAFTNQGYLSAAELLPLLKIQQGHHSKSVVKKATDLLEVMR